MRSSRIALGALVVGALVLPLSVLAFDRVEPPLNKTKAYEVASHVVEGEVKTMRRLDRAGQSDSAGPRFRLDLAVSKVHKTLKTEALKKGKTVSVQGWAEGDEKQSFVPREKEEVVAFLKRKKSGTYEAVEKVGFKARGGSRSLEGAPASPPAKKNK
jgi:hypothetical protein